MIFTSKSLKNDKNSSFFWNFFGMQEKTSSNSKNSKKIPKKFQSFYQKLEVIPKIPKNQRFSASKARGNNVDYVDYVDYVIWSLTLDVKFGGAFTKNSRLFWNFFGILSKSTYFYVDSL